MTRSDADRVADILDAAEKLAEIVSEGRSEFDGNWKTRLAAVKLLEVIGEAAASLTPELDEAHPGLPLAEAKSMRNLLAHEYWRIDHDLIWRVADQVIPEFASRMEEVRGALDAPPDIMSAEQMAEEWQANREAHPQSQLRQPSGQADRLQ